MQTQIEIITGVGSVESADFAAMLSEMYRKWAARNGVALEHKPSERGILLSLEGEDLDRLNDETGVHRLVRVSPHDPKKRRHTTFASVCVGGAMPIEELHEPVRSYVLDPYTKAKNLLTEKETDDAQAVLDGHLELLWE